MMKILLAALVIAVTATLATAQSASASGPTSPFLTPQTSGSVSVVQATVIDFNQHFEGALTGDQAKLLKGMVTPYVFTAAELAAAPGPYILIKLADGGSLYNMIYNFTAAESATIKTWLQGLPERNNVVVTFTSSWASTGRINIDTASWTSGLDASLMPYGQTASCNASKALLCLGNLQASIPFDCVSKGVPELKKCIVDNSDCLIHSAKGLGLVDTFCKTNRQAIDTLFCSDGRVGGDAVCDYVKCAMPDGKPATELVTEVDKEGIPAKGSACPKPSGAGSVLFGAVAVVLAIVLAMF